MRAAVLFVLLVLSTADRALAQFEFVTGLFKDVHSVTLYGQGALPNDESLIRADEHCIIVGLCGAGTEILIDLPSPRGADLELGLGASFLRRLESNVPSLDLHGATRSFPTFGAYLTLDDLLGSKVVQPYFGGNFGLTELWNVQAYDSGNYEYSVKSQAIEWGGTLGLYFNFPRLDGLFVEASYRRRLFSSLDYGFPAHADKADSLPTGWPRELDLSGWQFALGWQFDLKGDAPAAVRSGTWYLTQVDAFPLPATIDADVPTCNPDPARRRQLVTGLLLLSPSSNAYRMELQYRSVTVTSEGKELQVESCALTPEAGTYTIGERSLDLDPAGPGDNAGERPKYKAIILDGQLRVPSADGRHAYLFKRSS